MAFIDENDGSNAGDQESIRWQWIWNKGPVLT